MRGALLLLAALIIPGASLAVEPRLAADPATLKKLETLAPNAAVSLGNARVVGEFNDVAREYRLDKTGPRGRDYSTKMVWAPERQRALFLGANHAVPHRLNDVWEFDLGALTWAMLYAPDHSRGYLDLGKDPSDVEFRDGWLVTKRGGPAVIGHTWWQLTYDPVRREALFMNTWPGKQQKMVEGLGGDPSALYVGPPLWAFSPETRRWRPIKTPQPWPKTSFASLFEYIPELEGAIWHTNNFKMKATWLYDVATNSWRNLDARGFPDHAPKPEQVAYYDAKRGIVVAQRHHDTFHFDVRRRDWSKVLAGTPANAPYGHDASGPMTFDPHHGHGLLLEKKTDTLWAYDPDARAWSRLTPRGDPMPTGKKRLFYFDPAHRVFVVIKDTQVWAYRYAPAARTPR